MISTNTAKKTDAPNWVVNPLEVSTGFIFSADEVINAYFQGKKDQKSENRNILMEKLEVNLVKAKKASEELYHLIDSKGFKCVEVLLKVKNIATFNSLFIINEEDFVKDEFQEIYIESIRKKKELNDSTTFEFSTIFMPTSGDLIMNSLLADGYILNYGRIFKPQTRTA